MKVSEGEPLGGRSSAESDFAQLDVTAYLEEVEEDIFG
jgi:hypothetical protein